MIADDIRRRIRHAVVTQRPLHWDVAGELLDELEALEAQLRAQPPARPVPSPAQRGGDE